MPDRDDVIARLEVVASRWDRYAEASGHQVERDEAQTLSDALTLLRETWRGMESAPKQAYNALLLTDGWRVRVGHFVVPYEDHPGLWVTNPGGWIFRPTGWLPLPQLPKEGDNG